MLRSEHSIVRYDFRTQQVHPDRLLRGRDDPYLAAAKIMLRLYRDGLGKARQSLHRDVEETLSRLPGCPPRQVGAFCKLLDDLSTYNSEKSVAFELRQQVFALAAPLHPIVQHKEGVFEQTIDQTRQTISESIGLSWNEIDAKLFSDVIELQTLAAFDTSIKPGQLLSIYNVAQTQAALYRSTRLRIDAFDDFKTIVRHAKLAGLMHRIARLKGETTGYRFELDGPQSSLRDTTRYGIRFATLLPKLLACRDWRLTAAVIGPNRQTFRLHVSPEDGLKSMLDPPVEFDSELERKIFDVWMNAPVTGWTMQRERELLHQGQTVLTPDFVLEQTSSGRKVYLEVVGYWTPEYLREKCHRLARFVQSSGGASWLLLFPKPKSAEKLEVFAKLSVPSIVVDKRSKPNDWISAAVVQHENPSHEDHS